MPFPAHAPLAVSLLVLAWLGHAPAAEPDATKTAKSEAAFKTHVGPLLRANCLRCHGGKKTEGGLDLSTREALLRGGDGGPAVVPGDAKKSLLYQLAAHLKEPHMPDGGEKLPAADLAKLAEWIDLGAAYDAPLAGTARTAHWAFTPLKKPPFPTANNPPLASRNPIDRFVLAKLSDSGLSPNPAADRRTLVRRLKFDLLGLPPTPEEVDAFVNDAAADAYEKLVEKYLASPHYGERWARHWLDVVRFAESNGFETNQPRRNAWPYRDWVIKALNDDLPYDRFVREQLAGDSLGADAATGFLVAGAWDAVKSPDVGLTLQQRADELHDIVSTTGSAFLGLTVGCARCHAHKFDPVPQLDYYRIKAVFAGVQHGERPLRNADTSATAAERERLRAELAALGSRLAALEPLADPAATEPRRPPVNSRLNTERFRPMRAKFVRFVVFETNQFEPCIDELEVFTAGPNPANVALASAGATARSAGDYPRSEIHRLEFVNDGNYGNGRSWISNRVGRGRVEIELKAAAEIDRVVWGRDRQEKYTDRTPTRYRIDASLDGVSWVVVASSDDRQPFGTAAAGVPSELGVFGRVAWERLTRHAGDVRTRLAPLEGTQMVYAGRFTPPEPTHRLHRGDPMQKKEAVGPGVLSEIGPKLVIPENATDAQRRAAFAAWVTDPANPLTARVIVNRLWQYHFGTGLVDTPSDFGRNGGKPTHPELLDWLACELANPSPNPSPAGGGGKAPSPLSPPSLSGKGAGGLGSSPWSLKHVHRLIVTSATYRQSSAANPAALTRDAQARLLWRYPPRRIEAEAVRDSILFVSGKLDPRMGGPGFDLFEPNTNYVKVYTPKAEFGPAEFRRMIYQAKPRMQLDDTFGAFDCPDAGQIAPKRNVSTTPLQALNLLNSTFVAQQAGYFAERAGTVERVFRLAFQRGPTAKELAAAEQLVREHGLAALCRAVLNANEFVFVD